MSDEKQRLNLDELAATPCDTESEIDLIVADGDKESNAQPQSEPAVSAVDVGGDGLGAVYEIPVQLSAVLGKTTMPVSQLLRLGRGAVVELDRKVGEPIDILVNNRTAIFDELCQGIFNAPTTELFLQAIEDLQSKGAECVILGCTEFGLLVKCAITAAVLVDLEDIPVPFPPRNDPLSHVGAVQ